MSDRAKINVTRRSILRGMAGCAGLGGIMAAIRPLPLARAAAATSKTFLLVHGAWHGGWCYRLVD